MKLKKKTKTVVIQQNPVGQLGAVTLHESCEAAETYVKDFCKKLTGKPIGLTDPMWIILPATVVYVGEHQEPPKQPVIQKAGASVLNALPKQPPKPVTGTSRIIKP